MPAARRLPPLVSIEAFEAAVRLGSFAGAARELGTSAASVSYHVKQLESRTGLTLFRRLPQRVELTEAGAALASDVTAAFDGLRGSFADAADRYQNRLAISALPTFGASWLIPRLGTFSGPQIDLDLSPDPQDLSGPCEVAIRNGNGDWRGIRATRLFPAVFLPLCAPGLQDRIDTLPLLGRADWWALWFDQKGLAPPAPARFGTAFAAEHLDIAAAIAGQGVAIGSPIIFAKEIEAGRLAYADDFVATDGRAFWVCCAASRAASPKVERFRRWVLDESAAAVADVRKRLPNLPA